MYAIVSRGAVHQQQDMPSVMSPTTLGNLRQKTPLVINSDITILGYVALDLYDIKVYYFYMEQVSDFRRKTVEEFYKETGFENWLVLQYHTPMSGQEIADKIFQDCAVRFSTRHIQRMLKSLTPMRTVKESFNVAAKKGRIIWLTLEHQEKVKRKKISPAMRFRLMADANWECSLCGSGKRLTIDYIVALSKGGEDNIGNMQVLCWLCNIGKRDVSNEITPGTMMVSGINPNPGINENERKDQPDQEAHTPLPN